MLCSKQLNKCYGLYNKGNQIGGKKEEKFNPAQLAILLEQRIKNQEISQEFKGTAKQKDEAHIFVFIFNQFDQCEINGQSQNEINQITKNKCGGNKRDAVGIQIGKMQ